MVVRPILPVVELLVSIEGASRLIERILGLKKSPTRFNFAQICSIVSKNAQFCPKLATFCQELVKTCPQLADYLL